MVQDLFDDSIFIYVMVGLCILGVLIKLMVDIIYRCLMSASDNMGNSKNKLIKLMKLKFEACYKLKIGVNNVDAFVDKYVYKYKFCGIYLYTWENISGQLLIICMLTGTVTALLGLAYDCGRKDILLTFFTGVLTSGVLIICEMFINLPSKRKMIQVNIREYLDNFLKIRLEREYFNPELFEEYKNEYMNQEKFSSDLEKKENTLDGEKKKERKEKKISKEKQQIENFKQEMKLERNRKTMEQANKESLKNEITEKLSESENKTIQSKEEIEELINNLIAAALQKKDASEEKIESLSKDSNKVLEEKVENRQTDSIVSIENTLKERNEKDILLNSRNTKTATNESIAATKEPEEIIQSKFVNKKDTSNKNLAPASADRVSNSKAAKKPGQTKKTSKGNEMYKNEDLIIEEILKEFLA